MEQNAYYIIKVQYKTNSIVNLSNTHVTIFYNNINLNLQLYFFRYMKLRF